MTKSVVSNAVYNLIFQVLTALIGVAVTALLFKLLEPREFVSFRYLSLALFMLNYTNLGVPLVTTRRLARALSDEGQIDRQQIVVSFWTSLFICLALIFGLRLVEVNTNISVLDGQRFFVPLYGLIIFYFVYIHIRSVADGVGSLRLSRYVKAYFYISFFISAGLSGYYDLSVWINLALLLFFAILLTPKLFFLLSLSNPLNLRKAIIGTLIEGLPFIQLAIVTAAIGYLDRVLLPLYVSGTALATILFILDVASRQALIGTAMANVTLRFFISSQRAEAEAFFKKAVLACIGMVLIFLFAAGTLKSEVIQFLDIEPYHFSAVLNLWVGFSLLVLHSIQWQWMVALSLEGRLAKFLVCELLLFTPLLFIFLGIDAFFYLSVLLFLRAAVQILVSDYLIGRSLINILSTQLFFIVIFYVINTHYI